VNGERPALWLTGAGLVTPLGVGMDATWTRLVRGDRAMASLTLFSPAGQRASVVAEVPGVVVPAEPRGAWSRSSAMALAAAREALEGAKVDPRALRVGLVVAGTTSGMFETEGVLARLHAEGAPGSPVVELRAHPLTAIGDRLDESLGPFARVRSISSACSGGANAVVIAAGWLLAGEVDAVLAGGCDALCRLTLSGFNALGALDPEPCRPFDRKRRGTNLGEGAGFLVLERAERARARGATPIAELAGWAMGSEAHHITNPAAEGAVPARLMSVALARAGLGAGDVDYVNAHGTGTPANDAMEAAALRLALGGEARRIPVSTSKGQIGHTLGAAGAIEAVVAALAVARRTLVPTAGLEEPDPAFDLVHVREGREVPRVRAALSNVFGFGGMGTVLVFVEPARERAPGSPRGVAPDDGAVVTGVAVLGPGGRRDARDLTGCADLLGSRLDLGAPVDQDGHLDPGRARRLDRMARLGAVVVEDALTSAGASAAESGVILANAYGTVDACAAFMHRVLEAGPRAASPATFPNLVPSSPVGHVSIYAGMQGPAFATSDLAASGASAFVQACEIVGTGDAPRVVAGSAEPRSEIIERVLGPLFTLPLPPGAPSTWPRVDLAAACVVEGAAGARARSAPVLARVAHRIEWRGAGAGALAALEAPRSGASEVIAARAWDGARALLDASAWRGRAVVYAADTFGDSDALDAIALSVAAARVAAGRAEEILVLALAPGRGYAIVLVAP
jgi:3-oxoacyl-[acyl-carrier-protein] synthase II